MSLHRWVGGSRKPQNTLTQYKDGPLPNLYLFLVDLLLPLLEDMGPSDGTLTTLTMKELDIVAVDVHPKRKRPPLPLLPHLTKHQLDLPLLPYSTKVPRDVSDLCTPLLRLIPKPTLNGEFAMLPEFNTENSMAGCNKKKNPQNCPLT